jgi:hypothetical protein
MKDSAWNVSRGTLSVYWTKKNAPAEGKGRDNENDEYRVPVPVMDVWAEYHRLAKADEWAQQKIADAKGCAVPMVSRRVKWRVSLCKAARDSVCDGMLDEGHLIAFDGAPPRVEQVGVHVE